MGVPRVAWPGSKLSVIEVEQAQSSGEKITEIAPIWSENWLLERANHAIRADSSTFVRVESRGVVGVSLLLPRGAEVECFM